MKPQKSRWCADCDRESFDTGWCDICSKFICLDCDNLHDCLSEEDPDEDEEAAAAGEFESEMLEQGDGDFTDLFEESEFDDDRDDGLH